MFNYLIPLTLFISTLAFTPGPNNLMMATSLALIAAWVVLEES